jgi:NAD(P)H-dependent FMN reductase
MAWGWTGWLAERLGGTWTPPGATPTTVPMSGPPRFETTPDSGADRGSSPVDALLISGSTRAASTNTAMLRTVAALATPELTTELYADLAGLPAFNPDDDRDPLPEPVGRLRAKIHQADALLFCTPEYAGALPGAFKNLLDWTVGDAEPGSIHAKPVGWLNVAGPAAPSGGADAHDSLVKVLGYVGARVVDTACLRLPLTHEAVGADGLIADPTARNAALDAVRALRRVAQDALTP